jgi:hypothetical protein
VHYDLGGSLGLACSTINGKQAESNKFTLLESISRGAGIGIRRRCESVEVREQDEFSRGLRSLPRHERRGQQSHEESEHDTRNDGKFSAHERNLSSTLKSCLELLWDRMTES